MPSVTPAASSLALISTSCRAGTAEHIQVLVIAHPMYLAPLSPDESVLLAVLDLGILSDSRFQRQWPG